MERKELAEKYFKDGYNCSQAVVISFADLFPNEKENLLKIASPFGGGYSRMRETCGAVSGMLIVLGLLEGYSTNETGDKKAILYENTQELLRFFENQYGSLTCRELLKLTYKHDDFQPTKRTEYFYKNRPCLELIKGAVEILERYLINNKKIINS